MGYEIKINSDEITIKGLGELWDLVKTVIKSPEFQVLKDGASFFSAGFAMYEFLNQSDKKLAKKMVEDIGDMINNSTSVIINYMEEMQLEKCASDLTGLKEYLRPYDRCCNDSDFNRLSDADRITSRLYGRLIDKVNDIAQKPETALKAWPLFITVIALRAFVLSELSLYYKSHDLNDIWFLFVQAQESTRKILLLSKISCFSKFSDVQELPHVRTPEPGSYALGYTFDGRPYYEIVFRGDNNQSIKEILRLKLKNHMDNEYRKTPGMDKFFEVDIALQIRKAYFRVLERQVDTSGLKTHSDSIIKNGRTIRDIIEILVKSPEHKIKFIDNKSDEQICEVLSDHLLARSGGHEWIPYLKENGYVSLIDNILKSEEYKRNFGDDEVPGDGREGYWSRLQEQEPTDLANLPKGTVCNECKDN